MIRPNLDQFTGITRIWNVLFTRTRYYGTLRNYCVSFTWITYMSTRWIRNYYGSLGYNWLIIMHYMSVNKIISLLAGIYIVLVSLEFLVLSQRSCNVFCWGKHLSAGLADMLRQEPKNKVSKDQTCHFCNKVSSKLVLVTFDKFSSEINSSKVRTELNKHYTGIKTSSTASIWSDLRTRINIAKLARHKIYKPSLIRNWTSICSRTIIGIWKRFSL